MDEFFSFFDVEEIQLPPTPAPVAANPESATEAATKATPPPSAEETKGLKRKKSGPAASLLKRASAMTIKEAASGSEKKLGSVKQAVHQAVKHAVSQAVKKTDPPTPPFKTKVVQETHIWILSTCDVIYVYEPITEQYFYFSLFHFHFYWIKDMSVTPDLNL